MILIIFELILKEDVTLIGYGICLTGSHRIVLENSAGFTIKCRFLNILWENKVTCIFGIEILNAYA